MARYVLVLFILLCSTQAQAQVVEDDRSIEIAAGSTCHMTLRSPDERPADSTIPVQATGEASGPMMRFPVTTKGYDGDPALDGLNHGNMAGYGAMGFGSDVHVRNVNQDSGEIKQTMASDSQGNLYVAWEDDYFGSYTYIQIYRSQDGGKSWSSYAYVKNTGVDLTDPSIAIGEGSADTLLVAYIKDDGVSIPVPEVALKDLGGNGWTFASIPVWYNWNGYAKPVINTDSVKCFHWYAYLTCEGIVSSSASNINVCSWRSTDRGVTWKDGQVVFGSSDSYPWRDPDQSYGTSQKDLFLVCFNDHNDSIYFAHSDNSGLTWDVTKIIHTLPVQPSYPVDPEIAAAVNNDNIMVAATVSYKSNDTIGYIYSSDMGSSWSPMYSMKGNPTEPECGVSLSANEAGNSWHMAWNSSYFVQYASRPQSLSTGWANLATINDLHCASLVNHKKGVASVWSTDAPCVCWSSYRDNSPDYDTYADFPNNKGLASNIFKVGCSEGATVKMTLDAGVDGKNRQSLVLGSVSGTFPGTAINGKAFLPLNWDVFTNLAIGLVNTPVFYNFYGIHDSTGKREAELSVAPFTGGPTVMLNFAFVTMFPCDYASNPISIMVKP